MAVKLRLTRVGSKKNPIYRVVAADSRAPRDGKFLEIVGRYNPQTDPSTIDLGQHGLERPRHPVDVVERCDLHSPGLAISTSTRRPSRTALARTIVRSARAILP